MQKPRLKSKIRKPSIRVSSTLIFPPP